MYSEAMDFHLFLDNRLKDRKNGNKTGAKVDRYIFIF